MSELMTTTTKPFGVMELIARVKAVLRRTMEEDKFPDTGDIFLDDRNIWYT